MKTEEERKIAFMIGLAKLTRETGIVVDGCGCCGSPAIETIDPKEVADGRAGYGYGSAGEVAWISPNNKYNWDRFSESIVSASEL